MCIKEWEIPNKNTPQFKVGDIVKILPRDDSTKYLPMYVDGMQKYAGQLAAITGVSSESCQIDLDKGCWYWPFNSLELITSVTEEEKKLLDNALLEQGYRWNNSTKQLDSIGMIDLTVQPVDFSSFRNSMQKANDVANLLSCTKEETQTEIELNLFPTKKHYQLNFNY